MISQSDSEEKKILEKIVAISEEFLQSACGELNYQNITDNILKVSGAKYAAFNLFEEDGKNFRTVAVSVPDGKIKKITSLLGFTLAGKKWNYDPAREEKISQSTITRFSNLSEISGKVIPTYVIRMLEKTFDVGEVFLVKILRENIMIGDFTLIMPRNTSFKNDNYVEIYARQVGLLITRSRSEAKLKESELRFKSVFASVSDPIFLFEQKTGSILDVNESACKLYGYTRDEMLKLRDIDMSAEPSETKKAKKEFKTHIPLRYHKKKDGSVFTVEITASFFELNGRQVIAAAIRDSTERKKAEDLLLQTRQNYETFFNSIDDFLFVLDKEGFIIRANTTVADRLGYTEKELLGSSILIIYPKERHNEAKKIMDAIINGKTQLCHVPVITKSGVLIPVETKVLPGVWDGKPVFFGVSRDISKIKLSEEKFSTMFNLNPSACGLSDLESQTYVEVNEAFYKLFGFDKNEVIGKTPSKLGILSEQTRDSILQNADSSGNVTNSEAELKAKNGDIKHVLISSANIYIQDKIYRFTVVNDITKHIQDREALKISETKYKLLFDNMTTGFALHEMIYDSKGNPVDYRFLEVNPAFEKLTGLNASLVVGQTVREMIPETEQYWIDVYSRVVKTGESISFQNYSEGLGRWYESWAFSPFKNQFATIFTDITYRKKAEETIRESQEKFQDLAQMLPEVVFEIDVAGNLTFVNKQAFEIFGYSQKDFEHRINIFDMLVPGDRARAQKSIGLIFQGTNTGPGEYTAQRSDGSTFPILVSSSAIITKGITKGVRGLIIDITERKNTEKEVLHLSFHDHLTGLYNRRFFEEELKRLDTQRQLPLSFIMGDLNSLKLINDVFGHTKGDELLKETAEILKRVCRADDILARWGGDEFVLLLPKTSVSDAEELAQRIKKECKKTINQKIHISLSLGAATKTKTSQDIQAIVTDAESNMYKNKLAQKDSLTSSIIFALNQTLYEKSSETKEHTDRIHRFAVELGKSVKLSSSQLDELSLLASLHDIGKVAIPEKILLKKGKLTEKEWSIIKRHPEIGFNIAQSSPQIAHIAKSILSCHEHYDGSGYPLAIKGEAIPIISRIILIVDAYDVMTNGRIYKAALSVKDAKDELKKCAGSQFDPELVARFIEILEG